MTSSYQVPTGRKHKRIANRLAKHGLRYLRMEQADRDLISMRVILETRRPPVLGRAFAYPRVWLNNVSPRVIADAVLADFVRGYGYTPREHRQ